MSNQKARYQSQMKYFEYKHLPEELQKISKQYYELALNMCFRLPDGVEKDFCLRKLLEAKDCAVRSMI